MSFDDPNDALEVVASVSAVAPMFLPDALRAAAEALEQRPDATELSVTRPEYEARLTRGSSLTVALTAAMDVSSYFAERQDPVPPEIQRALYSIHAALSALDTEAAQ